MADKQPAVDYVSATQTLLVKAIKYIIEGLAVAVAAYFIPQKKMNIQDIVVIGISAAATFAILDTFSPQISASARSGAGYGIGFNVAGWNPMIRPM